MSPSLDPMAEARPRPRRLHEIQSSSCMSCAFLDPHLPSLGPAPSPAASCCCDVDYRCCQQHLAPHLSRLGIPHATPPPHQRRGLSRPPWRLLPSRALAAQYLSSLPSAALACSPETSSGSLSFSVQLPLPARNAPGEGDTLPPFSRLMIHFCPVPVSAQTNKTNKVRTNEQTYRENPSLPVW